MTGTVEKPYQIEAVVVQCSSRVGDHPQYMEDARQLGALLAQRGFKIIYGSGSAGLMGEFARAAVANGGDVTGIITEEFRHPSFYKHVNGVKEIIVDSLEERKKQFRLMSQASIALAGGFGTFDEIGGPLAEIDMMMTVNSESYVKPHLFINTEGYYTPLRYFFNNNMNKKDFVHDGRQNAIVFVQSPEDGVNKFCKWNGEGIMRHCDIPKTPAYSQGSKLENFRQRLKDAAIAYLME